MPKSYHLDDVAKDRYAKLRKSNKILPFQNNIKHDKLILDGSIRATYGQDYIPFLITKPDYDLIKNPSSWESVCQRRANHDPLMDGGNNNEHRRKKI